MARCGVHARTDLDCPSRLHPKALSKVDEIWMVADELHPTQRHCFALPTGDGGIKRSEVGREVLLEGRLVLRGVAYQAICHGTCHGLPSYRIEVDMRVPHRMHVAERTVDAFRHLQRRDIYRAIDVAWGRR